MEHVEPYITTRLSETQMRWWNVLHPAEPACASPYKFITISRDEGSLGDEVAQRLAERQGWRLYDREIVNYIATHSHVREDMVRQLDEKARGQMHNMILRMLRMPESTPFGCEEYHESLLKTLAALATHGNAILVGRGANFALRWLENGLHVRITGSTEKRIQRLNQSWHLAAEIARRRVSAIDEDRRAFIRHHFKQDANDLNFYTLVINTDHISPDQAVRTILALLNPECPTTESSLAGN